MAPVATKTQLGVITTNVGTILVFLVHEWQTASTMPGLQK
jgi:hypothetical protein